MRDCIYIGSTPCDEPCQQVGMPSYDAKLARKECYAFIGQLRRLLGKEPDGAELRIKTESHDFGSYPEVVCYYDNDKPASVEYAFAAESNSPLNWDLQAIIELQPAASITSGYKLPVLTFETVLEFKK